MAFWLALRGALFSLTMVCVGALVMLLIRDHSHISMMLMGGLFATGSIIVILRSIKQIQMLSWIMAADAVEVADPRFDHRLTTLISADIRSEKSELLQALRRETERLVNENNTLA